MARHLIFSVLTLGIGVSAYVDELGERFNEYRGNEPWLVQFYAPWCEFCKTFDAIWYDVGAELRSSGSPVNVGKMDTSLYTNAVTDFNIRGYPSIMLVKGDQILEYRGPRTKDGIMDFTNRAAGPTVRALTSTKQFRYVTGRHDVVFVYVGGRSRLKVQFQKAASEFVIYTYFFSASQEVLPQEIRLQNNPCVAVFKDGTYYLYNEERDGNLSAWVDRERFPSYLNMDSFTLYQMGERSKLVALAIVDERNLTPESVRYKALTERVAIEHRDHYNMNFQFGCMNGNDYINSFIMGELPMPSLVVMNMSIDGYYLPRRKVEKIEDLLRFLNSVLSGRSELLGGNGFLRQMKRLYYRARDAVKVSYAANGSLTCVLLALPVVVIGVIVCGMCSAVRTGGEKADEGDLSGQGGRAAAPRWRRGGASEPKKQD
ncbi:protein disulfide-isomerase tmx3a [Brachyhypopomus gauderio]|uniref:protein disulfide-isomerase tmx3a n=1 Tax=Brachyhypopomus gauderio TaxID=698409 RepID=UPI0040434CD5